MEQCDLWATHCEPDDHSLSRPTRAAIRTDTQSNAAPLVLPSVLIAASLALGVAIDITRIDRRRWCETEGRRPLLASLYEATAAIGAVTAVHSARGGNSK